MQNSPDREPDEDRKGLEERREGRARRSSDADEFWDGIGLDVDSLSPTAQLTTSLAVLIPVVVASVAVLFIFTNFWWFIFFFGWALFSAFSLLLRGIAGLSDAGRYGDVADRRGGRRHAQGSRRQGPPRRAGARGRHLLRPLAGGGRGKAGDRGAALGVVAGGARVIIRCPEGVSAREIENLG